MNPTNVATVEHSASDPHGDNSAYQGQRQVHHDQEDLANGAELDEEEQEDSRQGQQAHESYGACGRTSGFELATVFNVVPGG